MRTRTRAAALLAIIGAAVLGLGPPPHAAAAPPASDPAAPILGPASDPAAPILGPASGPAAPILGPASDPSVWSPDLADGDATGIAVDGTGARLLPGGAYTAPAQASAGAV